MERSLTGATLLISLLLFWTVTLWNLDRLPPIHNDEPAVLAPGYKLFHQGVYGSDLYAGFYGQEQLYLETMPLMPVLQGLSSWLFGVGVWPMRFLPAMLGLLTLALTFAIARRLAGRRVGLVAVGLLLCWQWSPGGLTTGSGIPLIDAGRIARYDILVPPLSLAAFAGWLQARRTGQLRFDFLSGLLVGLATLANIYGLVWLPILFLFTLWERWRRVDDRAWLRAGLLVLGTAAMLSMWGVVIVANWANFLGQFQKHRGRFSLFDPAFYVSNLLAEPERYHLGLNDPATLTRLGFCLAVIGLPVGLGWLAYRVWRVGDRQAVWLLLPCLIYPLFFALLIDKKKFEYLLVVMPLFAMVIAWGWERLVWHYSGWRRGLAAGLIGLLLLQGVVSLGQMQFWASHQPSPAHFFSELRRVVPASARVMGPPQYWLGLSDRVYRDFGLAFILVGSDVASPAVFGETLEQIGPQIVLMTSTTTEWLTQVDQLQPITPSRQTQFQQFMARHQAELIDQLIDSNGDAVQVYRLSW